LAFEFAKQCGPRTATERGISIDTNRLPEKHWASICLRPEGASNKMNPIVEFAKHELPRLSTERGTQIDANEQRSKHPCLITRSFDPDSNVNEPIL
jgi:hypothetical protein